MLADGPGNKAGLTYQQGRTLGPSLQETKQKLADSADTPNQIKEPMTAQGYHHLSVGHVLSSEPFWFEDTSLGRGKRAGATSIRPLCIHILW